MNRQPQNNQNNQNKKMSNINPHKISVEVTCWLDLTVYAESIEDAIDKAIDEIPEDFRDNLYNFEFNPMDL